MPRAKKQTKSGAIRAYAAKHPAAGPTEISQALKKQGIDVSPAHVSNVTTTSKKANGRRNGRKSTSTDAISLSKLVEARRFAERVGGVEVGLGLLQSLGKLLA